MPINHIGLCSWSVQPDSPGLLVEALQSTGIKAVQLALTPCVQEPDRWGGVMEHLQDAGITVLSGMMEPVGEDYSSLDAIALTGGVRQDASWPANEGMARAIAAFAAARARHHGQVPLQLQRVAGRLHDQWLTGGRLLGPRVPARVCRRAVGGGAHAMGGHRR